MNTYPPAAPPQRFSVQEAPGLPWPLGGAPVTGDLPDINVWLALAVREHPHHAAAQAYWLSAQARYSESGAGLVPTFLWFCRTTMLGLVRLLCQPKAVGAGALGLGAAWQLYQQYRAMPQIGLMQDALSCDLSLARLLQAQDPLPPRLWTDAYLAATAQASGLRLVSFDRDFDRFALSSCLILTPS